MTNARDILAALADGQARSGTELARRLGVSRAAIWKQVAALRASGLPIAAERGRGYCLPWPLELLDANVIRAAIPAGTAGRLGALEVVFSLDSTSSALRARRSTPADGSVLLAEYQRSGRGRRGRQWISPPGVNLCLSLCKRFESGLASLAGLPLAVGVMLVEALAGFGITGVGLKWPNDLRLGEGKLGGILVDVDGEAGGPCSAVVGVGLNLRVTEAMRDAANQPIAGLHGRPGADVPSRNQLAAALIAHLLEGLHTFGQHGWPAFAGQFARHDVLIGKRTRIEQRGIETVGRIDGVDSRGALRVVSELGTTLVDSVETSVELL